MGCAAMFFEWGAAVVLLARAVLVLLEEEVVPVPASISPTRWKIAQSILTKYSRKKMQARNKLRRKNRERRRT